MEKCAAAKSAIKPFIGNSKTFDALSHIEFYDEGLVECPVTVVNEIHTFLESRSLFLYILHVRILLHGTMRIFYARVLIFFLFVTGL